MSAQILDQNPHPDFDDYFSEAENFGLLSDEKMRSRLYLATETSRGCWKGEKLHCTFCGLNYKDISFRRKNTQQVVSTIAHLIRRYRLKKILLADRIMPKQFLRDVLPALRHHPDTGDITFWIESGSQLTRKQVRNLAQAGVLLIQTGIENLSTNILKCMRKGVSALKNVHFLKLCRTYGIYPLWTILVAVPGERQKDYDEMASLIPKLAHFTPPLSGVNPVRMHRFSPYFNKPGRWAENIRPPEYLRGLFPEDRVNIAKVAFDFDADWKDTLAGDQPYRQVAEAAQVWTDAWQHATDLPSLVYEDLPQGGLDLLDTRTSGCNVRFELKPEEASVYRAIDDPASAGGLRLRLGRRDPLPTLDRFVEEKIAICENGRYLGLAIPAGTPVPALDN